MTIRLLAAAESETGSVPPWRALVSACGGWEPYVRGLRRVHRAAQRHRVRAAGPAVPAFGAAVADRRRVTAWPSWRRVGATQYMDPRRDPSSARRIVGRTRTSLDYRTGTELAADRRAPADHPAADGVQRAHRRDQLLLPPGGRCDLGKHRR